MNSKTIRLAVLLVLAMATASCNQSRSPAPSRDAPEKSEKAAGAKEELSDLDRPVEELLTLTCEHKKRTFECEECRYETGFVRAPACLLEGGLIKTVKPNRQKVAVPISLTGEIRFDERRVGHVNSLVEGVIKKVHVALGDHVKKGQPLLEIESVVVGDDQAASLEAQGMLTLAQRNFERVSELRKENISSEKEFLQAKRELEAAEIRATSASSRLTRLGSNSTAGGRIVLRAPMVGSVLAMHAVSGEVARTNESLITVGDNASVWVWADLFERDIAAVKDGQSKQRLGAALSVKAYPGVEFLGTVELLSPAMDESSRTVKLRIEVENADGRLLAGMFAAIKVFLPVSDDALAVPRTAVLSDEGRAFVFIHHHDDYYVRRPVTVGRTWAGWVELQQGLEPAQTVVADGAFLMKSDVLRSKMGAGCAD